jgi:membrane protein DedA with SNARE-associated domain
VTGRIDRKWVIRGLVVAAIVAFFVFRDQLPSINLDKIIEDLSQSLGSWTYLLVGTLAFLETGAFVGLVAPGEFTVLLGGAVASQGDISLPLIIAVTWISAFAGDSVSFMLGAHLGRGFLVRHGRRVGITPERLKQVETYFARYGGRTILVGRFIGLVRALAPFIAGSSNLRYRAFAPYSILGTGLWSIALILLGYFFGRSLDKVTNIVGTGLLVFGIVVGIVVGLVVAYRFLRKPENRRTAVAEMEKRRALRPILRLGRRLRPQFQFLWRRLTPGGLRLEFTTLLAVLSVGLFVLIAYWVVIAGDPGRRRGPHRPECRRRPPSGLARGRGEDGHETRLRLGDLSARHGRCDHPRGPPALDGILGPGRRHRPDRGAGPRDQDVDRSATARGPAGLRRQLGFPERSRHPGDAVRLARGDLRAQAGSRDHAAEPLDRGWDRAHGVDRADPHLSASPLDERRVERLGAGGFVLRAGGGRRACRCPHPTQSAAS